MGEQGQPVVIGRALCRTQGSSPAPRLPHRADNAGQDGIGRVRFPDPYKPHRLAEACPDRGIQRGASRHAAELRYGQDGHLGPDGPPPDGKFMILHIGGQDTVGFA